MEDNQKTKAILLDVTDKMQNQDMDGTKIMEPIGKSKGMETAEDTKGQGKEASQDNSHSPESNLSETDSLESLKPEGPIELDSKLEQSVYEKKKKSILSGWINPINIFRENMTSENIDDETATTMVNIIGIIGGLVFIVVIGLAIFLVYGQFHSYSSQMKKAEEYEAVGDLSKAAVCYEKAIDAAKSKADKVESRYALAELYLDQESFTNAAYYLEQLVSIDKGNREAIEELLMIYEEANDLQAILALAKKADSESTEDLFADYLLNQPVFNYKSGTYDEKITVEIVAGEAERIYYTTDGTEATEMSKLYTEPIQLSEGHTEFHAMAISASGLMSENVVVNYEIVAEAPEKPVITPNSGTYRELTTIEVKIPDNCNAYYTLDGTVPTSESPEFTGKLTLPLGNHIFSVVFINHNGVSSEVASKVYDFIFSAPVTKSEALYIVKEGLVNAGELANVDGTATDPALGSAEFQCNEIITINDTQYYRVDKVYSSGGQFGSYAVEIHTGAVFSLLDNNGKYTLIGF